MPEKVLVIDDSPMIHTLVKSRLAPECLTILSAFSGEEGLAAARKENPDLILLDVEMPHPNGFDVCRRLKADSATMHIPIVFLTVMSTVEDKIRGLELGATDYITKPFDAAEMRARVRATLRTKRLIDLLAKKALLDGLTGLWNRAYLDLHLGVQVVAAGRSGAALSCVMADIDRFKAINDTYGHAFGDEVLRTMARAIAGRCRAEDILCRYGGEEFALVLPNTDLPQAAILAERLRAGVENLMLHHNRHAVKVTCSFGVAHPDDKAPSASLETADRALYLAKRNGRNRVECIPQIGGQSAGAQTYPADRVPERV